MRASTLCLLLLLATTTAAFSALGATQRFVITAPATGNLGEPFNFTVTAADEAGNPTGDYTGSVEFASHGVTVPASYTFTPADGGTKTFTGTPTRGGHVLFNLYDVDHPGIAATHSMEIACPGFTVTASNDGPICPGETPTLTASTSATGVTFDWQGPRFWQAYGQTVEGRADYGGTYIVIMSHPNGCRTFAETEVVLTSTPPNVQADQESCAGGEQVFTLYDAATNGPYSNIVWSVTGGQLVSGQGTESVTVVSQYDSNVPGPQFVQVDFAATNGAGCAVERRVIHEIHPRPAATIDTASGGCAGSTLLAKAVGASNQSYAWSIENGTILETHDDDEILYTVSGSGPAVITLVVTDPYCTSTITRSVNASGPAATIASAEYETCAGEEVQIPVTLTGAPPFTIAWSDGPLQTGVTGSFTRTVAPAESTHYSIVSITDANCSSENETGTVTVTAREDAVITRQPAGTTVFRGNRATLSVGVSPDPTAVQWYRGARGDRNNPVSGGTSLQLLTPPIAQETSFWAEIQTSCGSVMSNAATVKISSRRRAARHP
ncbi:MAG TPA: hypothetical protein VFV49_16540 [Thermoanaerobaculia bacterium]|nr:hypothetical protein [Thermoanaerobaculia bacterium]